MPAAEARLAASLPAEFAGWGAVARAQYLEMTTFLAGYLLSSQGDRMLMGHSVEGRFPFLDHRLAEFAGTVPASIKLESLVEKSILKRGVADLLPEDILQRPKQPYRAPDAASFATPAGGRWSAELLGADARTATGDRARVAALVRKWESGQADQRPRQHGLHGGPQRPHAGTGLRARASPTRLAATGAGRRTNWPGAPDPANRLTIRHAPRGRTWRDEPMTARDKVRDYIIENFLFGDAEPLADDTMSLLDGGIIDSVGVMELVAFLEQDFGLQVSDEELVPENLDSVANLVGFIDRKQAA